MRIAGRPCREAMWYIELVQVYSRASRDTGEPFDRALSPLDGVPPRHVVLSWEAPVQGPFLHS